MTKVCIPALLRKLTGGVEVDVDRATVRAVIGNLEQAFPGIGGRPMDGGACVRFRWVGSEVHSITAIKGGNLYW